LKAGKGLTESISGRQLHPSLMGAHNYRNAEAAIHVAKDIAPDKIQEILAAFESFPGVRRRQDILYKSENFLVIEDFAHHPVAIEETVRAVRSAYPDFALVSMFEPRSATSHSNTFQKDFARSFKGSKHVFVAELFNRNKVEKKKRLDVKKLVADIEKAGSKGHYAKTPDEILKKLPGVLKKMENKKTAILVMSNGAFGGIYNKIVELVREKDESN